jgi:trimeric autotransporter adhesin
MFPPVRRLLCPRGLISVAMVLAVVLVSSAAQAASGVSTTPEPTWGTGPNSANGRAQTVRALAVAGGKVYLGGVFTKMVLPGTGQSKARNRLAAFDVDSHQLLPWNPNADGTVWAMVPSADGTKLYVGGDFNHIGGKAVSKLARLDAATGAVDSTFRSGVRGRVRGLALSGDRLYVGGSFTSVAASGKTVSRPKLAALDATTGALLPWTPPALNGGRYVGHTGTPTPNDPAGDVYAVAVSADGSRVFVGGNFLNFAGQGGLLVLDGTTGQALPQQWTVGRPVFSFAVWSVDGQTVFASAGGPGGRVYAFRPSVPTKPLWFAGVDGDAVGVAASDTTVFLMGHYDFIVKKNSSCYQYCPNGTERHHLAAFDAATGAVDGWNPTANTSTGPETAVVGAGYVFVGGEFTTINGQARPGFAQFALPASPAPPAPPAPTDPSASTDPPAPTDPPVTP